MKLGYQLSLLVDDKLKELGHNRNMPLFDKNFCIFNEEELSKIVEIEFSNIYDISGIEHLKNLKKLSIISIDFTKVLSGESIENSSFINKIYNFDFIDNLRNLEELEIRNDVNIIELDVSSLNNLKTLILIHNPKLSKLKGLENLQNLQNVMIYGNNINSDFDIKSYIKNTLTTPTNILDISMYPYIIKGDRSLAKSIEDSTLLGESKIQFGEYIGFLDLSVVDAQNLYDMYTELDELFTKNNLYNASDLDKIRFVYNYVIKNVRFAKAELEQRNNEILKLKNKNQEIPDYLIKNFISLHNSYITFRFKKANCEGFINLMSFMFNMLGIESANVHCVDRRFKNLSNPNHSLIRLLYNNEWYYCDPTYDLNNQDKYFMKSFEKLQDTHLFSDFEIMLKEAKKCDKYNGTNINGKIK